MNVSVLLGRCPTEADLDTAAAQDNCRLRRFLMWLSIQLGRKPSKSCTSTMGRRTGASFADKGKDNATIVGDRLTWSSRPTRAASLPLADNRMT
jgi:hypothetical protein